MLENKMENVIIAILLLPNTKMKSIIKSYAYLILIVGVL